MKKFIFIMLALLIFQKRDQIYIYFNPPPDYGAMHSGEVILYATSWCGYCAKARTFLKDNHIPYYEYDIEKSTEGWDQHKSLGGKGVPVLLVNGKVINGFKPSKILEYLN